MSPLPPLADIRAAAAPAVVILGNDAILAARPATPVQLAHAALAAGFRAVVPASWGDELVAAATLDAIAGRATRPAIHCACPHVARRVLAVGSELAPHLVSLVAPPVAAARYLRLHSVGELRVTYVGRCPAASDDAIDARLTPEEFLAQLADRDIDLDAQPEVFESVIPPDRRRHLSLAGGIPSPEVLWARDRFVVETMKSSDFAAELANLVLGRKDALIDPAPVVGCVCSGAVRGVESGDVRAAVSALEPPRSAHPIVAESSALALELPLPTIARVAADLVADASVAASAREPRTITAPLGALGDSPPPPPAVPNRRPRLTPPGVPAVAAEPAATLARESQPPRRRSPLGTQRVVPGAVPVASDSEGRILPRAYVARRRSPRSGIPVVSDSSLDRGALDSDEVAQPSAPTPTVPDSERPMARSVEPPAPAAALSTSPIAAAAAAETATPAVARAEAAAPPVVASAPIPAAVATPNVVAGAPLGGEVPAAGRRAFLVAAGALAGVGLLLGVAIGYSVAHRRPAGSVAVEPGDRGSDSLAAGAEQRSQGVRESVSAGGIALPTGTTRPQPTRSAARPPGGRQTATTTARRATSGRSNTLPAASSPAPPATAATSATTAGAASPPAKVPAAPAPAAVAAPDTAAVRSRRDSLARAESLAAERQSIRLEIERRRARLDSIERAQRRLDSLQRVDQAQTRPPRR